MLSRISVRKPYLVVIILIIIIIISILSFMQLKIDYLPNINFPYMVVVVISPGLTPEEVEASLTNPTEDAIQSLDKINQITSISNEHVGILIVELSSDADIDTTIIDLNLALQLLSYPEGTMEPIITKINPTMLPIMTIALSEKDKNIAESSDYFNELMYKLSGADGVSSVGQSGIVENQILVMMSDKNVANFIYAYMEPDRDDFTNDEGVFDQQAYDAAAEQAYAAAETISGLLLGMVNSEVAGLAIYAQNLEFPVGSFNQGTNSFLVKIGDKIKSYEQLLNMPLISIDFQKAFANYADIMSRLSRIRVYQSVLDVMIAAEDPDGTYQTSLDGLIEELGKLFPEDGDSRYFVKTDEGYVVHPRIVDMFSFLDVEDFESIQISQDDLDAIRLIPGFSDFADFVENGSMFEYNADGGYYGINSAILTWIEEMNTFADFLDGVVVTERNVEEIERTLKAAKELGVGMAGLAQTIHDFLQDETYFERVYVKDELGEDTDIVSYYKLNTKIVDAISTLPQMLLTLKDVANVYNLDTAGLVHNVINGSAGVMFSVNKQTDYSTVDVTNNVLRILEEEQSLNPDLEYIILSDQGDAVMSMINSILKDLLIGAALAIIILFIFLREIKATFIVGLSMFMSVAMTFVLMFLSGIEINILSMSGLSLGIGMLVDNSIVVFENIYKLRSEGKSLYHSCVIGAKQMGAPITASTITTVIVFLPLIFLKGLTTQIVTDIALTLTFSLISSLFMALTFVPMASSGMLKKYNKDEGKVFKVVQKSYERSLKFTLKHKWIAIVPIVCLFGGSIFAVLNMNMIFFPPTDAGVLTLSIEINKDKIPDTKTYNEVVDDVIEHIYTQISTRSYVESVGIELSQGMQIAGQSVGGGAIEAHVMLKSDSKMKSEDAAKALKSLCQVMPGLDEDALYITYNADAGILGGFMTGDTLSIEITGEDLDAARQSARRLSEELTSIDGVLEVDDGVGTAGQEFYLVVDKVKAANAGLTVGQILLLIQEELAEPGVSTSITYTETNKTYDVIVQRNVFKLTRWIKLYNEDGAVVKVYISEEDDYYVTIGGSDYPVLRENGSYSYEYNQETVQLMQKGTELITYYSVDRREPLDLITHMITAVVLEGTSIEYTVTTPLWALLTDDSFARDAYGDIIYRAEIDENGNEIYERDIAGAILIDEMNRPIPVYQYDEEGRKIPKAIRLQDGYLSIQHVDGKRITTVNVKFDTTKNIKDIQAAIQTVIDGFEADEGVNVSFAGQSSIITEVYNTLYLVLGFAIILIYLVIVAQFQSLKLPFIIMFTIPLAFTGSIFSLLIAGQPMSVVSMVGLIVLMGVVVNNGIVLIDNVKRLIDEGLDKREAILKTARERLRPILMTTITTVIALFSAAINTSADGAMMRPIAITTVGGLSYATILTLYFVPIMFDILDKGKKSLYADIKDDENEDEAYCENTSVQEENLANNITNEVVEIENTSPALVVDTGCGMDAPLTADLVDNIDNTEVNDDKE